MMDEFMRLNALSTGRDKLLRFYWASLEKKEENKELITKLKDLDALLGTARAFLRFGRGVDMLYANSSGITVHNSLSASVISFSKLSASLSLLVDHIALLKKTGLLKGDQKKWTYLSNQFLFLSSFSCLLRDIIEIHELYHYQSRNKSVYTSSQKLLASHRALSVDTIKNFCDTLIVLESLGHCNLSPRRVSIIGAISSIASILQMINPRYRMVLS
ncbi:peroxisomal biogenesis factor 11ab isoform X2 [Brevipalpus obovatus]|uniref:peroxisomal biogenesis factor 11ab isoform X2 n=1 Tax=Brevipalpus obovatus TaxID=246614 RepID=UPI003D9DE693